MLLTKLLQVRLARNYSEYSGITGGVFPGIFLSSFSHFICAMFGFTRYSVYLATMHVMNALVAHGALVVDMTNGGEDLEIAQQAIRFTTHR